MAVLVRSFTQPTRGKEFAMCRSPYRTAGAAILAVGILGWPQLTQAAATNPLDSWTPWPMPLSVCFIQGNVSAQNFSIFTSWAFSAMTESWGQVPGVSFVTDCSAATRLNITIDETGCAGISSGYGVGAEVAAGFDMLQPACSKASLLHEVGHALGMIHEHSRADAWALCQSQQTKLDACLMCVQNHSDCSVLPVCEFEYANACFLPQPAWTVDKILTLDECNRVFGAIADLSVNPSAVLLTVYDPLSEEDYCKWEHGRLDSDYRTTALDQLGLEMLYPQHRWYPIGCNQGCMHSDGGVVVRLDGWVESDWAERGSLDTPLRPHGAGTFFGTYYAGFINAGPWTYDFETPAGELQYGAGTVTKSNELHAAMVLSTMGIR